jgi:ribose 5-phosphate isomerase A
MYSQDDLKKMAAQAAIACIEEDMVIGVGSGSTVHYFIEE